VSLVGPHAPDGSYSLLGWRHRPRAATITLEWSRIDETTVVGRLKAPEDVQLVLEAYGPGAGDFAGTYSVRPEEGQISGEHFIDCWPQGRSIRFLIVRRNLMPAVDLTSPGSLQAPQKPSAIPCSGTACTFRHSAWSSPASVAIGLMALADGLLVNGIVFLARF